MEVTKVTRPDGLPEYDEDGWRYGDNYYVVRDGIILNVNSPFKSVEDAQKYIDQARERDRIELMLHRRLMKKILRKRCSPDLHDYNIAVEVIP